MEMLRQHKIILFIAGTVLILGGLGMYAWRAPSSISGAGQIAKLSPSPEPDTEIIPTANPSLKINLAAITSRKEIQLTLSGLPPETAIIEYDLSYQTKTKPTDGISGRAKPKEGRTTFDTTYEKQMTLGTCSRNVCTYSDITSPLKVTIKIEGAYGSQIAQKEFPATIVE